MRVPVAVVVFFAAVVGMFVWVWHDNTATPGEAFDRVTAMTYTRDQRTGLCYAVFCWHNETRSVTYVPCTPEVLARIGGAP